MSSAMPDNILQLLSGSLADRVSAAAAGIIAIRSGRAAFSGFLWRPGFAVTAAEALPEGGEMAVTLADGTRLAATEAGRDPSTDVALLRLEGEAAGALPLQAAPPPVGSLVQIVGMTEGGPVAALGSVAHLGPAWRSQRGGEIDARIDLDAAMRGAAEGGLVLDAAGRAFGMAVFGPRRRVLVIPAPTIDRVAEALARSGRIARGYLGLKLQPVALDGAEGMGVIVMGVDPTGPGAAAGIRQGDVISAWDGAPIEGMRALLRALGPASVGTRVAVTLRRAGAPVEVAVAVGERQAA
jgi:S1-C subfamily serine protease